VLKRSPLGDKISNTAKITVLSNKKFSIMAENGKYLRASPKYDQSLTFQSDDAGGWESFEMEWDL